MRVLMISWEFPPHVVGGMGKHVAELVPALDDLQPGDEPLYIDVLTTRQAGGKAVEPLSEHVTVHRVVVPPIAPFDHYNSVIASNSALINHARRMGRKHKYDLIHIHEWSTGTVGIALKHEWKTPLLATIHATERGRHQGYLPSETSRQIDRMEWHICYEAWQLIICSRYMFSEVQEYFGVPPEKVRIVANGVDMNSLHICSRAKIEALRQKYAANGEKLLFFVGRITHEKGLQVLVHAMPQILAEYPHTRLLAAGKNSERMSPIAQEMGVDHAIDFLGYISDEARDHIYQTVDAAIFPSLYEPFGLVALEAMALNCNVIVSDVGGLREVVHHEENGLTAYPNDPNSVAWAVDHLFSNPTAATERRRCAYEQVQDAFSWQKIAYQTAQVYANIVAERRQVDW